MDRFHIVVSNYERLSCFVDNFQRIRGFDGERDRVYIMDCSPDHGWQEQMAVADRLTRSGLRWGKNLYFIRRRNWNLNHGAQLDYLRCLRDERIPIPAYAAFMQEHYLDLNRFIKEDTLPDGTVYDLDLIEATFGSDSNVGCVFLARYGIRISASNPVNERGREFFGDGTELLPGARRRCFCIDGGNFIVRPQLYMDWFKAHPHFLVRGNGTYGFAHVWEVRLGKILYDQRVEWVDLHRHLKYSTIEQLDAIEKSLEQKVSMLWYDHRAYFFLHGRDIQKYRPPPLASARPYLRQYLSQTLFHSRDTRLVFVQPNETER
ncbi:MAG: hypothetical protein ABSB96_02425 [Gaiellaceae bacterium]